MTCDHPDQSTRATALLAAATWQPWTPGQPESEQIDGLFWLAERFVEWMEGEQG